MTTTKTFVFPAYYGAYGGAGEHTIECVVPAYFADLTPATIIDLLIRHARRVSTDRDMPSVAGRSLLRAMGESDGGMYPSGCDLTPAARDSALSVIIRDFHDSVPRNFAPNGRANATHAEYVAHLLAM